MANPGDFAYTVKEQADIVRVVGDYVKLRRAGAQNFSGLCPFHNEKSASFCVHATRQFFHCFGCGASGDVFSFVQKIENITFPEAVRLVAQRLGIALPKVTYSSPEEERDAKARGKLLDVHERACQFFEEQLRRPEAAHAREYLAGRGLSPEDIAKFRIGFAPDSGFILRDRLKGEFDDDLLKLGGLLTSKSDEPDAATYARFRNRVMFPICNESGKVIAFTGRTLSTDEKAGPKYLNSPETPIYVKSRVLFNLDKAKDAIRSLSYAILVEGQMDCISLFVAGFHNVIASSGTAFTEFQARLLGRFSKKIVVNFDPDNAGAAAVERSLGLLVEEDFEIKVLTLEQGFDPDLFVRQKGKDAYAAALRGAPNYFDYLIDRARQQFRVRTADGKVKALNFLLPHIQRVKSRIVRDELAAEIAQKLGIDSAVLRQELRHVATARSASQINASAEIQVTPVERILVRALTSREMLADPASARDGAEEGFDPSRQARFVLESEPLHHGLATEALLDVLLHAPEGADPMSLDLAEDNRRLLAEILMREEEELTPELLEGAVHALRRRVLERRQRELQAQIQEAERRQDTAELARLMRDKLELARSLTAKALS